MFSLTVQYSLRLTAICPDIDNKLRASYTEHSISLRVYTDYCAEKMMF